MQSPQVYINDIYNVYVSREDDDATFFEGTSPLPVHLASMNSDERFNTIFSVLCEWSCDIEERWALSTATLPDGQTYYYLIRDDDPDEQAVCPEMPLATGNKKRRFI